MRRVFVTGMGAISSIGVGVEANLEGLKKGISNFASAKLLHTHLPMPVGELPFTNNDLQQLSDIKPDPNNSRSMLIGMVAAREALKMAGVEDRHDVLLLSSSTSSGIDLSETLFRNLEANSDRLTCLHSNHIQIELARQLNLGGRQFNISTACSSSANGIMMATRLIRSGRAERVLVGGNDGLSLFSLNGFNSLEIVSPTGCRPFDQNRNGVTLGEGGAYLVLESEEAAKGKTVYGEVSGYANVNEAYHTTATSPDGSGAKRAIADALAQASLQAENVSYINAHGTGTKVNDLSEAIAISETFGDKVPVSSTKGSTGHTLAACGALEAVFSLLSIREQLVFGNCRLDQPMADYPLNLVRETQSANIEHVLSNSFGFGGNDTSLIFSKI